MQTMEFITKEEMIEDISNLRYDKLADFFDKLADKLIDNTADVYNQGKLREAGFLFKTSQKLEQAAKDIRENLKK